MIVDSGKRTIMNQMTGINTPLDSVKVGAGSTPETSNQTDLVSSLGSIKKIDSYTIGVSDIVFEVIYGYNEGNGTINEVGLFDSDGNIFSRSVVAAQTKDSTKLMKIRIRIKLKRKGE